MNRIGVASPSPRLAIAVLLACHPLYAIPFSCSAEEPSPLVTVVPRPRPVVAPSAEQQAASIRRGVDFLLTHRNRDGSWGSATMTKDLNIYAPIPGSHQAFRVAVTSLAVSALLQADDPRPETVAAIHKAETWLTAEIPRVKRANQDAVYNVWAHAYAIEALVDLLQHEVNETERSERWRQLIRSQIDRLQTYESADDGWGYYDFRYHNAKPSSSPTSFTTATALIALHRAKQVGVEVPDKLLRDAVLCIQRQRKPDFSYYYSFNGVTTNAPMWDINRPGGSLGRSQACNLALRMAGDPAVTDTVLSDWLDRLFARNGWLDIGRKRPVPHESHFLVAGYFFYYGHWYAARSIDLVPADRRRGYRDQMARRMVDLQERDGSWWDYPFYAYHQPYGTAMAIMTLQHCNPSK